MQPFESNFMGQTDFEDWGSWKFDGTNILFGIIILGNYPGENGKN